MKLKLFFIAVVSCSFLNLRSQTYKAGTNLGYYYDIVPDTTIKWGWPVESYSLSLFGSATPNFSVMAYDAIGPPGYRYRHINIYLLDPNLYMSLGRLDSAYYLTWIVEKVPEKLSINDTINKSGVIWYNSDFCLTKDDQKPSSPNFTIMDWVGSNDVYIGLKYQNAFATEFGWIRLSVPTISVSIIKDYSTTSISTGLNNIKTSPIEVFPNPFSNQLFIENLDYYKIQLLDCLSREIKINSEVSGSKTKIMVDPELPKGVYYLKVSGKNGTFTKKLIKSL